MHQITLSYNPYLQAASIILDGKALDSGDTRFGAFVAGRPMDEWLFQFNRGYQLWKGFLLEAIEQTNDDALRIRFKGLTTDYRRFTYALQLQDQAVAGYGYEPGLWETDFEERFEPARFSKRLSAFTADITHYISSQMELLDAQECLRQLEASEHHVPSEEQMRSVCFRLQRLVKRLMDADHPEMTWTYFSNQLDMIMLQGD